MNWVPVSAGFLALTHRPGKKAFGELRTQGCTVLVTLLSEREGARGIQHGAENAGLRWLWLPLENASVPSEELTPRLRAGLRQIAALLQSGEHVAIHCSAGIHRTGMIAYALLRSMGQTSEQAKETLAALRTETAAGVGEHRLAWGDQFDGDAVGRDPPPA
jgi:protein-tyrosine phosphatase